MTNTRNTLYEMFATMYINIPQKAGIEEMPGTDPSQLHLVSTSHNSFKDPEVQSLLIPVAAREIISTTKSTNGSAMLCYRIPAY